MKHLLRVVLSTVILVLSLIIIDIKQASAFSNLLTIDTSTLYEGMENTYQNGYVPTASKGKAVFVLPLLGETLENKIRVTPTFNADGPFVYGNYQFDLMRTATQAQDHTMHEVFLVQLDLALSSSRSNGTYPVDFVVDYQNIDGEAVQQTFTLRVTITDGKSASNENSIVSSGGSGQLTIRKPVLIIPSCTINPSTVNGGEPFNITITLENVGEREAKNIRVSLAPQDEHVTFSEDMNAVFALLLKPQEAIKASFNLHSSLVAIAGEHLLLATATYEDRYGNEYTEHGTFWVTVMQGVSVGFDKLKLPQTIESGTSFEHPICVYNTGFATIYNVKCALNVDGILAATAYLGTIEPQQSIEKEIMMFVTALSGYNLYGETSGEMIVSYYDVAGQEYQDMVQISTRIIKPNTPTDEEKVKQAQEKKEQQAVSQWWISLLVGICIIAILVSLIVISKFSRMLRMR